MSLKIFFIILILSGVNCVDIPVGFCDGIIQGMFPHPDPTRCTEFVLCLLQNPVVLRCTRPNEIFHPPAGDCLPGNPDTCELFTPSPPTTTTDIPTTTTEELTTTTTEELTTTTTEELTTTTTEELTTTTTFEETTTTTEEITTTTTIIDGPTTTTEEVTTTTIITDEPTTTTIVEPTTTTQEQTTTTEPGPEITTPATTTTQLPIGPPELCVGINFRYVAHPDYCFRFFYCMFGVAFPGECDPDRIFSERWRGCVFGDWETCTPRSPILPWSSKTIIKINNN